MSFVAPEMPRARHGAPFTPSQVGLFVEPNRNFVAWGLRGQARIPITLRRGRYCQS